jgi:hypothetical protein
MNAPREPAHSPFGGSSAERVLRCPASVGLIAKVPEHLRKTSAYAERGTSLHMAMALLLDTDVIPLESLVGKVLGDYTITRDDIDNSLRPAFAYITKLLDIFDAAFYIERRVVFPAIPGAFGTADLLVRIGNTIHIDFKFGSGVLIRALADGDEDVLNAQLMFYAVGARHSLPQFFAGVENIILTIVQPQSIEPDAEMVSSVEVTHGELDQFVTAFRSAREEALSDAPRLARGPHCRFCPARPICPEHTKPLLDLAQFEVPTPGGVTKEAYLQALADGLNLVDAIKDIRMALHDQAKAALEDGDAVPGYALSAGRAERHWRDDENSACTALWRLGLERDDVIIETMRSPKQVELRAKARGLKVPPELIASRRSGVSLVRAENAHAPVLGRGELMRSFSEALAAFQGGRQS